VAGRRPAARRRAEHVERAGSAVEAYGLALLRLLERAVG
jgi:hypothetical protein